MINCGNMLKVSSILIEFWFSNLTKGAELIKMTKNFIKTDKNSLDQFHTLKIE